MINIFNELYTYLVNTLTNYDSNIKTSSVYQNVPTEYPFVSFEEIVDAVYPLTSDDCNIENHAQKEYEVNIYTQKPNKKSKADAIANIIDNMMSRYGFTRVSKNAIQDTNETIYRIILRYDGIVSKEHIVYRR